MAVAHIPTWCPGVRQFMSPQVKRRRSTFTDAGARPSLGKPEGVVQDVSSAGLWEGLFRRQGLSRGCPVPQMPVVSRPVWMLGHRVFSSAGDCSTFMRGPAGGDTPTGPLNSSPPFRSESGPYTTLQDATRRIEVSNVKSIIVQPGPRSAKVCWSPPMVDTTGNVARGAPA